MIKPDDLLEAIADAIRVRRRTPRALYPHPFECSLIKIVEDSIELQLLDNGKIKVFCLKLSEKIEDG